MVNEAIIIELLGNGGDPISYTVDNTVGIPKGTLLELVDPRTAKKVSGANVVIAGISAMEKIANDGSTTISVYTNCIAEMIIKALGSTTLGTYVVSAANDNTITIAATLDNEKGLTLGKSLETGVAAETVSVRILL